MRLSRFLFKYRITSTGVSPAKLMYGRKLRTQLDYLHSDLSRQVQQSQDRQKRDMMCIREFSMGDSKKLWTRTFVVTWKSVGSIRIGVISDIVGGQSSCTQTY